MGEEEVTEQWLVDLVAKAICEADADVDGIMHPWEQSDDSTRGDYRRMATAAIAALRGETRT